MNKWKFIDEFTTFLSRWMLPITTEDGTAAPLLTLEEAHEAIQEVQRSIFGVNIPAAIDYSSVKTPATGITVCTPSAPVVPKSSLDSPNISLGRYRSLDTLMTDDHDVTLKIEKLGTKSQEDLNIDEIVQIESMAEEKEQMSRSSPAINVSQVGRSETFIHAEEKAEAENVEQAGSSIIIESQQSFRELQNILKKIDELRECAANVVTRIDDVKKEVCPQSTKPIRRLSAIGGFPGLSRTSTMLRPTQSSKMRRSTSGIPGTPTSSKLSTSFKPERSTITTRRSAAAMSIEQAISPNSALTTPSSSGTTILMKKSPRTTINPKYAHVQSTIPKPTTTKRRPQ